MASALGAMVAPAIAGPKLSVKGEIRARYESLDGQFRAGRTGSDQALFTRVLAHAEYDDGPLAVGIEIQDSRGYLTDEGTPLSSSFINALNVLQAYVRLDGPALFGSGETTFGRQTISIGSKRQIERVSYANVIKAYTGVYHKSTSTRGDELHAFVAVPIDREPDGADALLDNDAVFDEEQWGRQIVGLHGRRADAFPAFASDIWAELFVYGLFEQDTDRTETPNRQYVYPGFRLYHAPKPGTWMVDLEPSVRLGSRRASSNPLDKDDLDVFATRVIAKLGYTWDLPWQPRLIGEWYWASGDDDPTDGQFDQYERLFGSRRTDLNNTSLHGPLTYANLNAPGFRIEVKPSSETDARLAYSAASLASGTDSFVVARLRDPSGQSGRALGDTWDARARYMPEGTQWEFEIGASVFEHGGFTRTVPGGPGADRTVFGYVQATMAFGQ